MLPPQPPGWSSEEVIHRGDEFFDRTIEAIDAARISIDFEVFIFKLDRLGTRVAEALCNAARRGVRVRLLVDGVGSWDMTRPSIEQIKLAGVDLRFYHPLPWHPKSGGIAVSLARLNRRNHRKLWVIDEKIAFVGSMNVTELHSESLSGPVAWRDVGAIVSGSGVTWLRMAFETAWSDRKDSALWRSESRRIERNSLSRSDRALVELNRSFASRRRKNRSFVDRILNANQRVWLINPYFVPSFSLLAALKSASRRKVDVRILVPKKSDVFFMPILARRYFGWLIKHGVAIHEFQPAMLHAKIALIDDWARIGSSNLNHRSLLHDLEVNITLRDQSSLQSIEKRMRDELSASLRIELGDWKRRKWPHRVLEAVAGLIRRWV
jgi:cardiolipin synthase